MTPRQRRDRERAFRAGRIDLVVSGGREVRCPNGHASCRLTSGRDSAGRFLRVWCAEPTCRAELVLRKPDQLELFA